VRSAGATCGFDSKEAYEYALKKIHEYHWDSTASKVVVVIGDDLPHPKGWHRQKEPIDWKEVCNDMARKDIQIYPIQCLNRSYATLFYEKMAELTGGIHLELNQFSELENILVAIACQQESVETLQEFRRELVETSQLNRSLTRTLNRLEGIEAIIEPEVLSGSSEDLVPVPPGTFQVLEVPEGTEKVKLKSFMAENGVPWNKKDEKYYEFLKPQELIQTRKKVVLQHKLSGDMFSGEKARKLLGIHPTGANGNETVKKKNLPSEYNVFVQSTSPVRVLVNGSKFLYKVQENDEIPS